jgi:hypothetical protein
MSYSEQDHFAASRKWQEYFDNHLRDIGSSVPPPTLGQTSTAYLRELCRSVKRTFLPPAHPLYQIQWRDRDGLRSDALQVLVPQLMKACKEEAENPATVPPGEFRQITKRNPYGQIQETRFVGPQCFTKAMMRPGRLLTSWKTEHGYLYPDGRPMPVAQTITLPSGRVRAA